MTEDLYPQGSGYTPGDWSILAAHWHPVALSDEIGGDRPFGCTLLDVGLVLYRTASGLTAALDHCPHRGTQLSLGKMSAGHLVCPYHGLEFDGAGACTRIPGNGPARTKATYLDIATFRAEERYGLVWVCLSDTPASALPDWAMIEQPGNQRGILHGEWQASAGRHLENFCDLAHFAFIHADTFGSVDHPEVTRHKVDETAYGFYFDVDIPMLDAGVFGEGSIVSLRTEYDVTFPFATRLTLHYSKGIEHICDVASPVSFGRTRMFILKSRDHDQHESLDEWLRFQDAVNEEDRIMVESQKPAGLPLTLDAERHLASDRFSVAYRKRWSDLGMVGPI